VSYLQQVIKASGGHAAPVEVLTDSATFSSISNYFSKPPKLVQEPLKTAIEKLAKDYEEEYVEISDLIPTQVSVDPSNFKEAKGYEKPVIIYKDMSGMYLVDGHHRCATKVISGNKGIKAKVYKAESMLATAGSKPAPKKDRIKGSKKNKSGSAAGGKKITFSKKVEESLQKKADEHNEKHGDTASKKTSVKTLKAVYRRGAGAFSTSHRPDQNRNSWSMARVNAFLHLLRTGSPKNSNYTTDNDLLPAAHRRSTKSSGSITASAIDYDGYIEDQLEVTIPEKEDYTSKEHVIHCMAEFSGLGYEVIPSLRAAWKRAEQDEEDPYDRVLSLATETYRSKDYDLLPRLERYV
jgi:hypothetical protein